SANYKSEENSDEMAASGFWKMRMNRNGVKVSKRLSTSRLPTLITKMESVLNVVLSHQPPADVDRLATYWESLLENGDVVVAYGGPHESFGHIQFQKKLFIDDSSLRTLDHQREGQSYTVVFKKVSRW